MISLYYINCNIFLILFYFLHFFDTIELGDKMECIFCKIIKGEIPSYKVYEDDQVMAFLDINPYSPGHTLIIPKKHTLDINSITDKDLMHIMKVSRKIAKLLTEKLNCDGFTLIQNNGFVQEVKHFHLHVIPKYKKNYEADVKEIYEKITQ